MHHPNLKSLTSVKKKFKKAYDCMGFEPNNFLIFECWLIIASIGAPIDNIYKHLKVTFNLNLVYLNSMCVDMKCNFCLVESFVKLIRLL